MTNKPKADQPCQVAQIVSGYQGCIITNNSVNPRSGMGITLADGVYHSGVVKADISIVVAARKKWWEFWK